MDDSGPHPRTRMLLGRAARFFAKATAALTLLALAACGDGAGAPPGGSLDACGVSAQKDWLRSYMLDQYLWTGASPYQ